MPDENKAPEDYLAVMLVTDVSFAADLTNIYGEDAQVFEVEGDNEKLREVGFFNNDDNAQYEISVYDLGTTENVTDPTDGILLALIRRKQYVLSANKSYKS